MAKRGWQFCVGCCANMAAANEARQRLTDKFDTCEPCTLKDILIPSFTCAINETASNRSKQKLVTNNLPLGVSAHLPVHTHMYTHMYGWWA